MTATAGPSLPLSSQRSSVSANRHQESRISRLTQRQADCLRLVAKGYTSKEIGRQLGISYSTVDNHVLAAAQLLGVPSRAEAARQLVEHDQALRLDQNSTAFSHDITRFEDGQCAETRDQRHGQELPRQPAPLAVQAEPREDRGQDADARWIARLTNLLPPIGGRENVLSRSQRVYAMARVSLFSTLVFVACVIVIRTCFDALR